MKIQSGSYFESSISVTVPLNGIIANKLHKTHIHVSSHIVLFSVHMVNPAINLSKT